MKLAVYFKKKMFVGGDEWRDQLLMQVFSPDEPVKNIIDFLQKEYTLGPAEINLTK